MSEKPSTPNFSEADSLLDELFNEVTSNEGNRSGGTAIALEDLDVGGRAVGGLYQTKVSFGNPKDNLIALSETKLHNSGVELTSIRQEQMQTSHDFYYMTINVNMRPKPGAQFKSLTCELNFGPKGADEPIVQTIFPQTKWKDVMQWGGGMELRLNGNLDWEVGVDLPQVDNISQLPADVAANVDNKNNLNSFIVLPDFSYDMGRFDVAAYGDGTSECFWQIEEADLQKTLTVQFGVVFKVPKGTKSFTLRGIAWAEPNMSWLTTNVKNVFGDLGDKLKALLKGKDKSASKLARGAAEEWTLDLS